MPLNPIEGVTVSVTRTPTCQSHAWKIKHIISMVNFSRTAASCVLWRQFDICAKGFGNLRDPQVHGDRLSRIPKDAR